MQTRNLVTVHLEHEVSTSFLCQRAANSLDIDTSAKSVHELSIECDVRTPFNLGLILGASGSGKTTLAHEMFGKDCFKSYIEDDVPIIDQFPKDWSYDDCARSLIGIGLTSVPCWIRPVYTLSNGQRVRAEAALIMSRVESEIVAIDEWTSVVDRTVAKAMSHCVQKHARRTKRSLVLLSCHYDVVEWLNPDWIIDCNDQTYTDRRSLWQTYERKERLTFEVRECAKESWQVFRKYHYLTAAFPRGKVYTFGLFENNTQVGFNCFAKYSMQRRDDPRPQMWHSNRIVIHPDYVGLGLGMQLINVTSEYMARRYGYRIMGKFSAVPMIAAVLNDPCWKILRVHRQIGSKFSVRPGNHGYRKLRENVLTVGVEYVGPGSVSVTAKSC